MTKRNCVQLLIWMCAVCGLIMTNNLFCDSLFPLAIIFLIFNIFCCFLEDDIQWSLPIVLIRITGGIRYILIPCVMRHEGIEFNSSNKNMIIAMCAFEMIAIYIAMIIYKNHRKNEYDAMSGYEEEYEYNNGKTNFKLGTAAIIVLVIGGILVLRYRFYLERYFSLSGTKAFDTDISGVIGLLVSAFFVLIYIIALRYIKYLPINANLLKILLSLIISVFFVNGASVTGSNVSRWNMIICAYIAYLFINRYYPGYKKFLLVIFLGVIVFTVIAGSMMKFENSWNGGYDTVSETFSSITSYDTLNAYFSGPKNMDTALELKYSLKKENIPVISTFISDLFANFPLLNKYLSVREMQSNVMFNRFFYGSTIATDQILPFSVQMYIYLGPLFIVPIIILVYVSLLLSDKLKQEQNFLNIYCLTYIVISFGLLNCINFTIMVQHIWIYVLPIALISLFNMKFRC